MQLFGPWREMVSLGLTTWAEQPEPTCSDSHAWSAHPNYAPAHAGTGDQEVHELAGAAHGSPRQGHTAHRRVRRHHHLRPGNGQRHGYIRESASSLSRDRICHRERRSFVGGRQGDRPARRQDATGPRVRRRLLFETIKLERGQPGADSQGMDSTRLVGLTLKPCVNLTMLMRLILRSPRSVTSARLAPDRGFLPLFAPASPPQRYTCRPRKSRAHRPASACSSASVLLIVLAIVFGPAALTVAWHPRHWRTLVCAGRLLIAEAAQVSHGPISIYERAFRP